MSPNLSAIARETASLLAKGGLHATGAARSLHRRFASRAVTVLSYHGVSAGPLEVPEACFVDAAAFASQMDYLAKQFDVLHIEDAMAGRGTRDRPVACITFDDGFAGVYHHALPVLRRLGLPASVYLVTDLVDSDRTVWFAELHQAITRTGARSICVGDRTLRVGDRDGRRRLSAQLQEELKRLPQTAFGPAFDDVLEQLGAVAGPPEDDFRILDRAQVHEMERDDVVRFGGHTASHQILTRTTLERATKEITSALDAVRLLVERPSEAFAYPNGGADDFDTEAVEVLRSHGVQFGLTTIAGPYEPGDDPYRVRRYVVGASESRAAFATKVHHTSSTLRRLRSPQDG